MMADIINLADHPRVQARRGLVKVVDEAAIELFGAKERAEWLRREYQKHAPAAFDVMATIRALASLADD